MGWWLVVGCGIGSCEGWVVGGFLGGFVVFDRDCVVSLECEVVLVGLVWVVGLLVFSLLLCLLFFCDLFESCV